MIRLPAALACTLAMAACTTVGVGTPVTPPPAVAVGVTGTGYGFDVAYGQLVQDYLAAAPTVPSDQKAQAKGLMLQLLSCPPGATAMSACTGYIAAADLAVDTANQASLTQQLAYVSLLIGQIKTLLHPGTVQAAPSVASLAAPPA